MFKKLQGKPARDTAKPDADPVFTRIDPEINEIRNGNVDTGCSVAGINSLKASFPEFYQVKLMEDNEATITVMSTASSASMRHMNKTQNINFKWLKQQFENAINSIFSMLVLHTKLQTSSQKPLPDQLCGNMLFNSSASARQRWEQLGTTRSLYYCQGAEVSYCCRECGGPTK